MKKIRLLTSLSALLFILSITACTVEEDDSLDIAIPENSESNESSPSSSNTGNDEDNNDDNYSDYDESYDGYYNYTLAFTFTDSDGNTTLLPDNATAYILGGWDNWVSYTPLTLEEDYYYTTFDKIETGTYRYKVVMWFSGEDVSWLNCVEITDGNQILRVGSSLTDNYFNNITLELNVSLPNEEERENKLNTLTSTIEILEKASEVGCLSNLWDSVHIEAESPDDKSSYNICLNPDNDRFSPLWNYKDYEYYFIYGVYSYEYYDWNIADYYYFKDGLCYDYGISTINAYDPTLKVDYITYNSYSELIDDYSIPFSDANELINLINLGVDSDGKAAYYSITTEGNEYTLIVNSEAKGVYTYKCTNDFKFTYISYQVDDYFIEVEQTSIELIDEKIDLLRASFNLCVEPCDVFKKLSTNCNYSVQFEFQEMVTNNYITYKEYCEASEEELYELEKHLEDDFELIEDTVYICYTEDALFIRMGYMIDDDTMIFSSQKRTPRFMSNYGILLVNGTQEGNDYLYVYFSDNYGASWQLGSFTDAMGVIHASSQPIYEGHWQDYCHTMVECYNNIVEDDLYYDGLMQRTATLGTWTLWLLNSKEAMELLFKCLGGEILFGNTYNEYLSTIMELFHLCFDPYYQRLEAIYSYESFFPGEDFLEDDWEINDDTHLYIRYLEVDATVKNFGTTSIYNELVEWTH